MMTSLWRINHEAMEARASGPQFLGQKFGPRIPTQFKYLRSLIFIITPFGHRRRWCYMYKCKNCSLYTMLTATDRKTQNHKKGNVNHTNIDVQAMLVWLTLLFMIFCGFRSVAVNSVYKLQFFTIYRA